MLTPVSGSGQRCLRFLELPVYRRDGATTDSWEPLEKACTGPTASVSVFTSMVSSDGFKYGIFRSSIAHLKIGCARGYAGNLFAAIVVFAQWCTRQTDRSDKNEYFQ